MELGALFVGLAMLVGSLPFVIKPLRGRASGKDSKANIRPNPEEKRKADLSALLDLDFDYRTGKVSEEDYSAVRAQLVADAAQYIQSETPYEDEHIEALIAARRATHSNSHACSKCGHTIGADSRFCSQCGTAVAQSCPSCGKSILEGDLFCTTCGAKMEHQVEAVV
jgi:hypothetical protein